MATQTTPVKPSKIFSAGFFAGIGNTISPTPTAFDTLQDMSLSFKRDVKSIFGEGQFPDDVCAGPTSINWKATMGSVNGRIMGDLIAGAGVSSTGQTVNVAKREKGVVNGSNRINVKNHGASVFLRDCGVIDVLTNLPLIRVAAITKKNHYTVETTGANAGRYTFHEDRQGDTFAITYEWQGAMTGLGAVYNITNLPQGKIGDFTAIMGFNWADKEQNVFTLNSNITSDFEIASKNGDYGKPTISGMAMADDYGNVGTFSFAQQR